MRDGIVKWTDKARPDSACTPVAHLPDLQETNTGEAKGHTLLSLAWTWKRLAEELGGHFECQVKKESACRPPDSSARLVAAFCHQILWVKLLWMWERSCVLSCPCSWEPAACGSLTTSIHSLGLPCPHVHLKLFLCALLGLRSELGVLAGRVWLLFCATMSIRSQRGILDVQGALYVLFWEHLDSKVEGLSQSGQSQWWESVADSWRIFIFSLVECSSSLLETTSIK